jgi:hypothetical protein
MIGRFSIYVLIKFEIRLRLKVIYSNLLALNGTFRTVATQTPITTRQIEERIAEIQRDLKGHYAEVVVNLLGLWQHRGNVELYFKHRYKDFNYPIGSLTEYFRFADVKTVLNDLFEMESKELSGIELGVMKSNNCNLIDELRQVG